MPELESKFQVIVSKRAAQQLVEHAVFMARLEERLARQLAADFWKAADSLQSFPDRNPILRSSVFVTEKYRKWCLVNGIYSFIKLKANEFLLNT